MADARRELVGQSRRNAALELDGGLPPARANARRLVLAAVERWKRWREQPPCLAAQEPPLQEVLETIGQNVAPETEPAPQGDRARGASRGTSPPTAGSPWRTPPGAPAARAAPQRSTAAKRTGPWTGTATSRARVGAVQPTHRRMRSESCWRRSGSQGRAGASWTSTWGRGASPRLAPGAAPGGHIIARPWRLLLEVPGMRCWRVGVSCGVEDDARRRVLAASRRTGRGP